MWVENSAGKRKFRSLGWSSCPSSSKRRRSRAGLTVFCLMLMVAGSLIATSTSWASVKESDAVRAIVGEAENQGYRGMVAVAEAIRNRGHLKGVYGLRRDLSKTPRPVLLKLYRDAKRAWKESKNTTLVNGGDHWENVKDFGMPKWAKRMKVTATIGDHVFFRGAKS